MPASLVGLVQGRARAANGIAHSRFGAKPLARSECAEGSQKKGVTRYVAEEIFAYFMGSCRDGVPCFIVEDGLESLQEEVKILCVR